MFFASLLWLSVVSVICAASSEESGGDEVVDLQKLLKEVSESLNTFAENIKANDKQVQNVIRSTSDALSISQKLIQKIEKVIQNKSSEDPPRDCASLFKAGERKSGVYQIKPWGWTRTFAVYCDMETSGGGWTVFQRHGAYEEFPSDFFDKDWEEYKTGFGDLRKEFWLGNENIFALTNQQDQMRLRVDLLAMDKTYVYASYRSFKIEGESQKYKLSVEGYTGTAGNSLEYHNGMSFSTRDRDYDKHATANCGLVYKSGWWYNDCGHSWLNSLKGPSPGKGMGITWHHRKMSWDDSLSYSEMKIRPNPFL